jgi:pilus assembly protein CpaC
MSRVLAGIVIALGFLQIASSTAAETPTQSSPAAEPPAVAAAPAPAAPVLAPAGSKSMTISQVPPGGPSIALEVGKGTLIRLNKAAATVFIANPDVADVQVKSPSLIYLSAKSPGETVVYAVDADDNVLLHAPVQVSHDLSRVRQSIHTLLPGENIAVNSVENSLVLSGEVSTAGRSEKARSLAAAAAADVKNSVVVNQLAVDTPNQINLRVKIAEVNRTALKALGFNWGKPPLGCGALGGIACNTNQILGHPETTGPGAFSNLLAGTNNPFTNQSITTTNTISYGIPLPGSGSRLEATLDALSQEGLITTLAEPNLTATNGQTASFLAGGEFPVPVAVSPGGTGAATISIDFKKFGVALDFTPTIIDANHLSLHIRPEVSQLTSTGAVQISGFSIPALTVRRADTTVELGSGESFALAGLLQNTSEQDISKIPWLGDIPILGQLFRSELFQRNETELVIIVTPYLVRPTATALATPTDGFSLPHDMQRIATGDTYRQTLPEPARGPVGPGAQGLIGPVGFRLD